MPTTATLTDDERLALAAVGGWQIADALSGVDGFLWSASGSGSIDDLVLMHRPGWRGAMYRFGSTGLRIVRPLHEQDEPLARVSRSRVEAFAAAVAPETRAVLRADRECRTYAETTRLVWWGLGLARPPAEVRPTMASRWARPVGDSPVRPRTALGSPATATVAAMGTEHSPETVAADARAAALRAEQAAGQPLAGGQLWGLPVLDGDMWADIAGATAITGLPAKTITSYLVRGKPKSNPFPQPSRFLGRNYWPVSVLTAWSASTQNSNEDSRP
ncbi:hypothetical protein [Nocardia flavorosea]|uniref:Uncharacterized protein n=1 Tax=Nocardia flavorosea TaxID=53429 RepID=A0A846YV92_9NOCA|nr:hypothetical protein [Nocardia flavorosea]NKY60919.1 hypothetical protein [Nocardia flavorosea]